MRPDEHKKKKNAEYKKKHGMSAKKEGKKEEIKKDKPEKPQEPREKEETISIDSEKKSFSRRKVTSNWDRYEEFEGETDDTHQTKGQRGADFASLMERTVDSHSHFRFRAEKEWEEDLVGAEETQDVLKINFEDLSQRLNSLPLYKKLDLEEKEINYTEQEDNHDQRATTKGMLKCIDIHDEPETLGINQKRSSDLLSNQQPALQMNFNFSPPGANSPKTRENKKMTSNLHQSTKDLSSESSHGLNTSAVTGPLYSMRVIKKTKQLDDEELDFLLSLETGQHQRNSLKTPLSDKVAPSTPLYTDSEQSDTNTTADTPKLSLPQDENTKSPADSSPDTKSETTSDAQKPKEDLEDWLDSVLG